MNKSIDNTVNYLKRRLAKMIKDHDDLAELTRQMEENRQSKEVAAQELRVAAFRAAERARLEKNEQKILQKAADADFIASSGGKRTRSAAAGAAAASAAAVEVADTDDVEEDDDDEEEERGIAAPAKRARKAAAAAADDEEEEDDVISELPASVCREKADAIRTYVRFNRAVHGAGIELVDALLERIAKGTSTARDISIALEGLSAEKRATIFELVLKALHRSGVALVADSAVPATMHAGGASQFGY